jgi:hypothetical protein
MNLPLSKASITEFVAAGEERNSLIVIFWVLLSSGFNFGDISSGNVI